MAGKVNVGRKNVLTKTTNYAMINPKTFDFWEIKGEYDETAGDR